MAVETFGVFTGGLGIVQFLIDNIPGTEGPQGNSVAIKVGSAGVQTEDYGGVVNRVDGFDAGNQFIGGFGARRTATRAQLLEITLDQDNPDVQAQYISITAGDDNICIASAAVTQRDGADLGYGWLGDVGMQCNVEGVNFAPNDQAVGNRPDGAPHAPFCTWFEEGFPGTTFKFNGAGYRGEENRNDGAYCANTLYSAEAFPISGQPGARRRRSVSKMGPGKERPANMANSLVISSIDTHNMTELCGNERMWSPDFIGVDDVYCDVATHTAYPLCSRSNEENCVVLDKVTKTLTRKNGASSIARGAPIFEPLRTFSHVEEWLAPVLPGA